MADHENEKKEYFSPKIVHTEKMTSRAVTCSKADQGSCGVGPLQS